MARDELELRVHSATVPDDLNDPPRFSQLVETTKDAFVLELRRYLEIGQQTDERLSELPTVEKYALYGADDPYETVVQILQDHADVLEALPHVAVTTAAGSNKRLTFGRPIIAQTQRAPRIETTLAEPFALADGDTLVYQTTPDGLNPQTHTVIFRDFRFPTGDPITAATAADVARVFNEQALYAHAKAVDIGGGSTGVRFATGGPAGGGAGHNEIEILTGTSANVLTAFGLSIGASDDSDNPARPPANRYHTGAQLNVNVDIVSEDPNTRREVTDLIYSFFVFWLERKHFQFFGRSVFDESVAEEHYQIIIHQDVGVGAESAVNRPNDQKDKVHMQRITVPVTTFMYIDRPVLVPSGPAAGEGWIVTSGDVTGLGNEASEDPVSGIVDLPTPN